MDITAGHFRNFADGVGGQAVSNRQETFFNRHNRDGDFLLVMHESGRGKINGLVGKSVHAARAD